ncbi:protein of unknown function [Faunimonas pinastri]|uniref:3'-5' exoribonuclease Rv2179c-like domain-containing protein n=1 Tax=Faunimonas pinastri TaxID=1855383 RepID=A0A1H9JLX5_9HYPH|nr:protein of unknown function [Faunimonas pinastri]
MLDTTRHNGVADHLMIDLETLTTNMDAPITAIGACVFNPENGQVGATFEDYRIPDLERTPAD